MLKDLFSNGLLQLVNREIKYKSVQNDLDMADLLKKELTPESIINESKIRGFMRNHIKPCQNANLSLMTNVQETRVITNANNADTPVIDDTDSIKIVKNFNNKIYYVKNGSVTNIIFDADIIISNKLIIYHRNDEPKTFFEITIRHSSKDFLVNVPKEDYAEKAFSFIRRKCPSVRFYSNLPDALSLMKDYMNEILSQVESSLPIKYLYKYAGWEKINSKWYYLHGNLDYVESSRCLKFPLNASQAFIDFFQFSGKLLIAPNTDNSTIIFLHAHLGYLARLLTQAHFPPHYLLFLKGKTNTGKTSLLSELGGEIMYNNPPLARLEDTRSYLEGVISEMNDSLLLIDDAHPSPTLQMERTINQNIELIVRAYGDFQTRGKRGIDKKSLDKTALCGANWLTGEYLHLSAQSSSLRVIEIELNANTVNREVLSILQKNRDLAREYFSGYILFLQNNFENLVRYFNDNLSTKRNSWKEILKTDIARTVDIAVTLDFIAYSVYSYAQSVNYNIENWLHDTTKYIQNILSIKIDKDINTDPINVFKNIFKELYDAGTLKIASTKEQFKNNMDYIGFEDEFYFNIINSIIEKNIKDRCREKGIAYLPPTLKQLFEEKIILNEKPSRFSQKRADNTRPTMITIKKFFN